jgi:hypothetical protein
MNGGNKQVVQVGLILWTREAGTTVLLTIQLDNQSLARLSLQAKNIGFYNENSPKTSYLGVKPNAPSL